MIKTFWLSVFFSLASIAYSQTLKIIDNDTRVPVGDVYVYNESLTITRFSDENGLIDISEFGDEETLFFQHPAYENSNSTVLELKRNGLRFKLTERIVTFNEIVVSANKWEQNVDQVSRDILSISSKTISFQNPQTSADLLENTGQIFVQKSQFGGGSPTIRGFAANKVLLVMDGVRLNNAIYRGGNLQNIINIDPNSIENTEILFGPGSVIYGSDALGGVMNFKTKDTPFSIGPKPIVKGGFLSRFGTAAKEFTNHVNFGVGLKNISYWGSYSYSDMEDLRAGSNRSESYDGFFQRNFYAKRVNGIDQLVTNPDPNIQRFSGFSIANTIHKLTVRTGDYSDINYGFYYSTTSDIPRYDRLTLPLGNNPDSLENSEWYYGPQKWMMHKFGLNYYKPSKYFDQMKFSFSYQDYTESRNDRGFGDDNLRTRTENVDIFTGTLDFEKIISPKTTLYYGIDGFHNNVNSTGYFINITNGERSATASRYPDGGSQYSSLANYYSLGHEISEKWYLNLGVRYNAVWLKATTSNDDAALFAFENTNVFNQAVTGSIGSVFRPNSSSKFNFVIASGFRAPNIDDVGKLFELDRETIIVPNPELKPEYVYSQEVAYQLKINPVTQLDIVFYHSFLTNAIIRGDYDLDETVIRDIETAFVENGIDNNVNQLDVRSQVNSDEARVYGGSIRFTSKLLNHLALISSFNMNEGVDLITEEPLRHSTPIFGQTQIKFYRDEFTLTAIGDYHLSRDRDQIPPSEILDKPHLYTDEGSPGWFTLDIRSSYNFPIGIGLEGGVENVFDTHYRTYSSGISAPGRNLYFSARYRF